MKLLVARPLDPELVDQGLGPELDYRPELEAASRAELGRRLEDGDYDGALVASEEAAELFPFGEVLAARPPGLDRVDEPARQVQALGRLERRIARRRAQARRARFVTSGRSLEDCRVLLVGAGIVNLVTAWSLSEEGAQVEVLDAGPDPRRRPPWLELGSTHGGGNGRMVSPAEGTCYNLKLEGEGVLRRTVAEGGWLLVPHHRLMPAERSWIERFESLPRWRSMVHAQDVHRFNHEGAEGWRGLRRRRPELFEQVGLSPGVLYLDSSEDSLARAERLQNRLGGLRRRLDRREVARCWPALAPAVSAGEVAGGLELEGFSLAVHRLVERLLTGLERRGVRFGWRRRVRALRRDDARRLTRVETTGASLEAEHVVVSAGAHGEALLVGSRCAGLVQGVLGLWLELPELAPGLGRALKIHRRGHVGEDSNVLPVPRGGGGRQLLLGAGYGFLGQRAVDPSNSQLPHLYRGLCETARRFLPASYDRALADGSLYGDRRACVRPFTANGLGLFEVEETSSGGRLIVTTGHNTGGFTQAPAVARAVVATLRGESAAMADLYAPERGTVMVTNLSKSSSHREGIGARAT